MRKYAVLLCGILLAFGSAGVANAYPFQDVIDFWSFNGSRYGEFQTSEHFFDAVFLSQDKNPFRFSHDISDDVDLTRDYVTDAWLELDFTNMDTGLFEPIFGDIRFNIGDYRVDFREFVRYALDDGEWIFIGEIDEDDNLFGVDDVYTAMVDIGLLNDDGLLDVQIQVFNFGDNPATISLDHSKLYGNAEPVPEPATMLLLGTGLVGLAGIGRKKFFKKP